MFKTKKKRIQVPKVPASESLSVILTLAADLYEVVDTPISLSCAILLKYGEYAQIANKSVDPLDYKNAHEFSDDYQAVSYLKKFEKLPTGIDTQDVALKSFIGAERQCRETNRTLLDNYSSKDKDSLERSTLLFVMQREISNCLGAVPDVLDLDLRFGPGATSSAGGTATTVADKLVSKPECTRDALPYVRRLFSHDSVIQNAVFGLPVDAGRASPLGKLHVVLGNRLAFVPKSAKTDRAICVEPHLNTLFQKGIGKYMRKRLGYFDINLKHQPDVNSFLAKLGSVDGSYATIDLSSASDTISNMLVLGLLPIDWFELLSAFRSPFTTLPDGSVLENEKFSSMGNGFTFELETLIFAAAVKATLLLKDFDFDSYKYDSTKEEYINGRFRKRFAYSVFGDDIILPTEYASSLIVNLELLGFSTNVEKTFISGPFRESCGKDYYHGQFVRPYFQKKEIKYVNDYYKVANSIRLISSNSLYGYNCDRKYRKLWFSIVNRIPKRIRFFGPKHLGDIVLSCSRSEVPNYRVRYENHRRWVATLEPVSKKRDTSRFPDSVILAAALFGASERIPIRGTLLGFKRGYTPIPGWDWFDGGWI